MPLPKVHLTTLIVAILFVLVLLFIYHKVFH